MSVSAISQPSRAPVGAQRVGICPGCDVEGVLVRVAGGWRCGDCGHVNAGRFRSSVRPNRTLSDRVRAAIVRAYQEGETAQAIAAVHGTFPSVVYRVLRRAGVPTRRGGGQNPNPSRARRVELPLAELRRYPAASAEQLADELGVSTATVRRRLADAGLTEYRGERQRLRPHLVERSAEACDRAARAAELRAGGAKWIVVAMREGYTSEYHAAGSVAKWRRGGFLAQEIGVRPTPGAAS